MKLLTLNTHSLIEEDYETKRELFVQAVLQGEPDLIALQEVNQSRSARRVEVPEEGNVVSEVIPLCSDNHAYLVAEELKERGLLYNWVWLPMKIGYSKYDEGLAVFSRFPIEKWESARISESDSYENFRTRYALGVYTADQWIYCVHTGRWKEDGESFLSQWGRLSEHLKDKGNIWLMGDFNNPAEETQRGYDLIKRSGWYDSYIVAEKRDSGITVPGSIDGWRDRTGTAMRIDYIFSNFRADVLQSEVVFNGKRWEQVSDHYGVMIEVRESG